MKKILALALALLLVISAALAEEEETVTVDFEVLTMECAPDCRYEKTKKEDAAVWFMVYPAYSANGDDATTLNGVWSTEKTGVGEWTETDIREYADSYLAMLMDVFAQQNLTASDPQTEESGKTTLGGRDAVYMGFSYKVDYSALGNEYAGLVLSLSQRLWIMDAEDGSYTFTATSGSFADIDKWIQPMMDSLQWK